MKRVILTLMVLFIAFISLSQTSSTPYGIEIPEQDTSLLYIADTLNSVGEDLQEIGNLIKEDYDELGFKGFIRTYKYFIIIGLVFIVLTLLWFRKGTDEEK